jgi:molybdopterin synthase catalytic subunit
VVVKVQESPLEPWRELENAPPPGSFGATTIFVGTLRDFSRGRDVTEMTLEHYPGMTESYLQRICDEAARRWDLVDTLVVHRVGRMAPGDPIVLVAVWSSHRDAAFPACRYIIDELKTRAPFWKREQTDAGPSWVAPEDR